VTKPESFLLQGAEILGKKLYALNFAFEIVERGKGSGGEFAVGSFRNGDRELRLWFRFELGGVFYRKNDLERTHAQYMQAIGRERDARYPGFSHGDQLAGFRHLLEDLEHCDDFLTEGGKTFYDLMKSYQYRDPPKGFAALTRTESTKPRSN